MLGADVTYVLSSDFFLEGRRPGTTEVRKRVRLGVHWQGENNTAVFYGMT